MAQVALRLRDLLADVQSKDIIGIGTSGGKFAQMVLPGCAQQMIETISFSRERARRVLACEAITRPDPVVLIDDIAVSGSTLRQATQAVDGTTQAIGVGLLYDSKTTRKEIGLPDIRSPIVFSRQSGGRLPVNSIDSLIEYPERCQELADRYFGSSPELAECLAMRGACNEIVG